MGEDTEDTIIRPRRHPVSLPSDADIFADTVVAQLHEAPPHRSPPTLIEPPEPMRRGVPPTLAEVRADLPGDASHDFPTQPHAAPSRRAYTAPPPTTAPVSLAFHSIRVGDSVFALDVPAFIGRHPSTPRILGTKPVRLVRVTSPSGEVSSTHVSIEQQGASVVVTDLGSTNGTIVTLPGGPPIALRRGESMVVLPGGVIDLGDSVVVDVLAAGL